MSSKQESTRKRRHQIQAVKEALRDLNIQLSLLNRQFGARVDLKDADWDCLDLLNRHGPLSPTVLARTAGLHPATMTGILDRLQRGGWITRERVPDAADRRAVIVRARRERNPELFRLFSGMNAQMDELCENYTDDELELIVGFLRHTAAAGNTAADQLANS